MIGTKDRDKTNNQPQEITSMIRRFSYVAILAFILSQAVVRGAVPDSKDKERIAVACAEKWLSMIDGGKYADAWSKAAAILKGAVQQDQFAQQLGAVRKPLGKLVNRSVKSSSYSTSMPGGPDGEYVVIQFDTAFEGQKNAVETVTPMLEKDGTWRIVGYFIK